MLAGAAEESLLRHGREAGRSGLFSLCETAEWLGGYAAAPRASTLAEATRTLYGDLFRAVRGLHLSRIWNYVPAINAAEEDGLERYRGFCRERSLAFEAEFGPEYRRHLPAASAVGTDAQTLRLAFLATKARPRHIENPRQVPAYDYPLEHGPRPPSFARATVVPQAGGEVVFISGTAAVTGHSTWAPDDTAAQVVRTLENLREISCACGLGADLGAGEGRAVRRQFKVYLRHAGDCDLVTAALQRAWLRPDDTVSYLRSDICRRALTVEIEATIAATR